MEKNRALARKKFNPINYGVYIIFALILIVFASMSKAFVSLGNLSMLISNSASLMVVCTGLTFVIITGALDLSVGSTLLLSGMIINLLVAKGIAIPLAILAAVAAGTLIGIINGVIVAKLHANAFLVTYGTQIAMRGLALTISGNVSIFTDATIKEFFRTELLGLPLYVFISFALLFGAQFVLRYTTYGRKVITVGCNEAGAEKIGINTHAIRISVFALSGLFAALAGLVSVANVGNCTPYTGSGVEFNGAAAILMGGTSMYGGKGSVFPGTLIGIFLLQTMENGLTVLGVNPYYLSLVRGGLIFIAMFADSIKNKRA